MRALNPREMALIERVEQAINKGGALSRADKAEMPRLAPRVPGLPPNIGDLLATLPTAEAHASSGGAAPDWSHNPWVGADGRLLD